MSIPINGRIAILDDNPKHALPIMKVLGKQQCPTTYYTGELKYLPDTSENSNDIRVLFLDIYLTGDESRSEKEVKSTLVPVLSKLISDQNFPYVIVYWSRHKDEHGKLIMEIFEKDLPEKKPIAYLSLDKTKFFTSVGDPTPEFDNEIEILLDEIITVLNEVPVYNSLLEWENLIHLSADRTIESVFSNVKGVSEWEANANTLFQALGISFSGKHFFRMEESDKNKNSLSTLNQIFIDTLEHEIDESNLFEVGIEISDEKLSLDAIHKLNSKLLIQNCDSSIIYPGTVLETTDEENEFLQHVFNNIIDIPGLENHFKEKEPEISKAKLKRECSSLRKEMRKHWKKIWVVVTPLCDHVQRKSIYTKIVRGALIESKYSQFLDDKSESIFISPPFDFDDKNYVLVLQYRNFFSVKNQDDLSGLSSLFRLRQNLIVEVQSKLSRHLSRQGVLYLDPNLV